ncbi:MAG: hypothetical protein HN855_03935 [Anaerolineae bacterium]|jgi:hypothetical protein|nr:hypothetical protein [Anaerolineae bacterium]MBT7070276.1 hypothetical protein [Anaerolineae bacterium]MBT7324284.1 hypothetical protein [Anaerolineae bacterium]
MKKVKIFLASSAELKEERQLFEIEIYRKCKAWFEKGIFLHLEIWEDMSAKMSASGRSQSDYNEVIKECDILILLAYTKVGIYTAEEFEVAHGQFRKTEKPFIFTYFKDAAINTGSITPEFMSLLNFKQKLSDLGHFYSTYTDFHHLWNQFNKELERLADGEFQEMVERVAEEKTSGAIHQHNIYGDNIGRDKVVGK